LRGDLLPAAGSLIDGAELDIKLKVENNGFVPVYLPVLKHQIAVTGAQVTDSVVSRGVWLGPRSATPVELSAVVPFKQLPKAALAVLTSGGIIEMEVHSAMELGGLVLTKRSQIFRVSVAETIESRVKSIIGR